MRCYKMGARRVCTAPAHKKDAPRVTTTKRPIRGAIVLPGPNERKRNKSLHLRSQINRMWFSPPNNNILLREYKIQQQQLLSSWGRSVFFCTRSKRGPQLHPLGGRLLQLSKAHGISQTRNPALCREGHFTFVECRRRRITVCATIYDKNQMANLINPKLSMTRLTPEESRRVQQSPDEPRRAQ